MRANRGHGACMAKLMLTLAVVSLVLAILAGVLGMIVAGPVGPILCFVFLALFLGSIAVHYIRESRARRPFK
jgi:flagellar biosynthesis component FlhA